MLFCVIVNGFKIFLVQNRQETNDWNRSSISIDSSPTISTAPAVYSGSDNKQSTFKRNDSEYSIGARYEEQQQQPQPKTNNIPEYTQQSPTGGANESDWRNQPLQRPLSRTDSRKSIQQDDFKRQHEPIIESTIEEVIPVPVSVPIERGSLSQASRGPTIDNDEYNVQPKQQQSPQFDGQYDDRYTENIPADRNEYDSSNTGYVQQQQQQQYEPETTDYNANDQYSSNQYGSEQSTNSQQFEQQPIEQYVSMADRKSLLEQPIPEDEAFYTQEQLRREREEAERLQREQEERERILREQEIERERLQREQEENERIQREQEERERQQREQPKPSKLQIDCFDSIN